MFDGMSDEEYARLLGLVRGASGGEPRFPSEPHEKGKDLIVANTQLESPSVVQKEAKATSIDGTSATTRLRVGTLRLPQELLERIRVVLHGTFRCISHNDPLWPFHPFAQFFG